MYCNFLTSYLIQIIFTPLKPDFLARYFTDFWSISDQNSVRNTRQTSGLKRANKEKNNCFQRISSII